MRDAKQTALYSTKTRYLVPDNWGNCRLGKITKIRLTYVIIYGHVYVQYVAVINVFNSVHYFLLARGL